MTSAIGDHSHEGCFYSDTHHATKMYTMHYNPVSTLELKAFIRTRTHKEPPNGLRRYQYIRMLEEMDRNWTFRFMDLPPEMRNAIYELLLMRFKAQGRKAFLAILRVSKQVHKEAVGIFNDVNTADLGVGITRGKLRSFWPRSGGNLRMHLDGDIGHIFLPDLTDKFDVKTMLDQRVSGLARMRHIRLRLNINWYVGHEPNRNWILPIALTSSIAAAAADLRTLVITVLGAGTQEQWVEWLTPLAQLPSKTTLQLEGFGDEAVKQEVLRQIEAAKPKIDAGTSCTWTSGIRHSALGQNCQDLPPA
ncbi:hypothetical protein AC579_9366 [Pseudocercospora musae]|uniref:F-box domain-containing protein n=1 Tax=Pseudocercospora musae TaxID=113226 RepID=A0A139I5Q6_9PEZI|nr:hypothetical protein AC579_9366 [Pseudocercospora musae]